MRQDLLDQLTDLAPLESVVVATYNVDLEFLDAVVVPFLRRRGSPRLVVLADGEQARLAFARSPTSRHLGSYYRLVPFDLGGPAFHAKLVVARSAEGEQRCWIGSGNLTYGGWRGNAEIWERFDGIPEGLDAFFTGVAGRFTGVARHGVGDALLSELHELLTLENQVDADLLFQTGDQQPIGDGLAQRLVGDEPHIVCSPYVDANASALTTLAQRWGGDTEWWVPDQESGLREAGLQALEVATRVVEFPSTQRQRPFVHAKLYASVGDARVKVAIGSANCSQRALFLAGQKANVEILSFRTIAREEWDWLVAELKFSEGRPRATAQSPAQGDRTQPPPALVVESRVDGDLLTVTLVEPSTGTLVLIPEGRQIEFENVAVIRTRIETLPHSVVVEVAGVRSQPHWVHVESELRKNAKARSLSQHIRAEVTDEFTPTSWGEVMRLFGDQLSSVHRRATGVWNRDRAVNDSDQRVEFDLDDVYVSPPQLSVTGGAHQSGSGGPTSVRDAILGLLEGRFDSEKSRPPPTSKPDDTSKPPGTSQRTQRDSAKVVVRAVERFLATGRDRSAFDLGTDLKILGFMLLLGYRREWLTAADFVGATERIWSAVFVNGVQEDRRYAGLLEEHHSIQVDRQSFEAAIGDVDLVSILAIWAFTSQRESAKDIDLAILYAVSRNIWLWGRNTPESVETQIRRHLSALELVSTIGDVVGWWNTHMRHGDSLREFEMRVSAQPLEYWRHRLGTGTVKVGELTWQGADLRFCRVCEGGPRDGATKLRVESVVRTKRVQLRGDFALPLRMLLRVPEFENIRTDVLAAIDLLGRANLGQN